MITLQQLRKLSSAEYDQAVRVEIIPSLARDMSLADLRWVDLTVLGNVYVPELGVEIPMTPAEKAILAMKIIREIPRQVRDLSIALHSAPASSSPSFPAAPADPPGDAADKSG